MRLDLVSSDETIRKDQIDEIPTYIIPSVISFLFCCLPAIMAIIFSILTIKAKKNGDYASAETYSASARTSMTGAFVLGAIALIWRLVIMN